MTNVCICNSASPNRKFWLRLVRAHTHDNNQMIKYIFLELKAILATCKMKSSLQHVAIGFQTQDLTLHSIILGYNRI